MPPPPRFSLLRAYLGDLLEPATYRAALYHLLALPLALLYFSASLTALLLGLVLLIVFVGFPILVGGLSMVRGFAALERSLGTALLDVTLERPRPLLRPEGLWASGRAMLSSADTYKTLLYLMLKLPFSLLMFTLGAVLLTLSLGLILSPLLGLGWIDPLQVGSFDALSLPTPLTLLALVLAGVALLVLSLLLLGALSRGWAFLNVALLTDFGESAEAQLEVQALRQGARAVAYHGDLPTTLTQLLEQGLRATPAQAALVFQQGKVIAQHTLEPTPTALTQTLLRAFPQWHAQQRLAPPERQALLRRRWTPDSGAAGPLLSLALWGASEQVAELHVIYPTRREPSQRELEFWGALGHQIEAALETAQLIQRAEAQGGEQERSRLARELHDSVAQALFGISMGARAARAQFDRDPAQAAENLEYTAQLADGATREMRALLFALRPEALEEGGLGPALERLIEVVQVRHGLEGVCEVPVEPELSLEHKAALYRIAQEAVHNAVKHAHARAVRLWLGRVENAWLLHISDDGQGFDPAQPSGGTLGLKGMRERAQQLGATLELDSRTGGGTSLVVHLPTAALPTATQKENTP